MAAARPGLPAAPQVDVLDYYPDVTVNSAAAEFFLPAGARAAGCRRWPAEHAALPALRVHACRAGATRPPPPPPPPRPQ